MKKVLVIAYYFPPIGGSGVQRPAKFVKYLPQFGWHPYVITTDRPYGDGSEGWDDTLLADFPPDVQIWRVPTPQPRPVRQMAKWLRWQRVGAQDAVAAMARGAPVAPTRPSLVKRLRSALLRPLHLVENPPVDSALYWSVRIIALARHVIRTESIDAVLTTVPPWSPLLTGLVLQKLTGRPWVADFRDPWTEGSLSYFPTPAQRRLDQCLERHLVTQADAVISVTEPCLEGLRRKAIPHRGEKPFALIPNGWDQADFPLNGSEPPHSIVSPSSEGPLILLHPGSAYPDEPIPLLRALERLESAITKRLQFRFIGYMHPVDRFQILSSPYASCFRLDCQRVPHPVALSLMRESHVLLLLRKGSGASSGKIFEYMRSARPVLAIASGVAADLVNRCGIGCSVEPDHDERLAELLSQIALNYAGFLARYYHPIPGVINQYDRRLLTHKLAQTLDQVIA